MKKLLPVVFTALLAIPGFADPRAWNPDGLPIRTGEHVTWEQTYARSDDGTTLVVWCDARNGNYDVFAQAFNGNLDSLWSVAVCTQASSQRNPAVCAIPDGWIVAWTDSRNGTGYDGDRDFCVQKLDLQGNVLWDPDGVLIVTGDMPRDVDNLCPGSDGDGGTIIAFSRHISTCSDVFAQRVDQNGQIVWPDLLPVAVIPDCSQDPIGAVSDTNGDLLVAWSDCRGFYGARITPEGDIPWGDGGRYLGYGVGYNPATILYDGVGGFYLGWTVSTHTCAQHIASDGSRLWDSTGVRVCTDSLHSQIKAAMALSRNDGQVDGLVFAWQDTRFGQYYDRHIYAQKLDLNGTRVWAGDGVRISLNLDNITPSVQSDGEGGAVVGWLREEEDQAAQRLSASGAPQWTTYGVDVTIGTARQERSIMLLGEDGNISMLWPDATGTSTGIRAQRLQMSDGARMLGNGGRSIIGGLAGWGDMPQAVTLGGGRVGIVWSDRRGSTSPMIYYQIVNPAGEFERVVNGEPVTPGVANSPDLIQTAPSVCPDDSGGFFVIFDERFTWDEYRIRLAHVGGDGEILTPPDGRLIDPGFYYGERYPRVVPDGVGGCYVVYYTSNGLIVMRRYDRVGLPVWNQLIVSPSDWPSVSDVVSGSGTCTIAYRTGDSSSGIISCIDSSRNLRWQSELSGPLSYAYNLRIASDRQGGVYAVWSIDTDSSNQYQFDLYAQRFDSTGAWMWGQNGVAVYAGPGDQYGSSIAVSSSGELYVAWGDSRNDPDIYDIYAQKFSLDGDYLWPENGLLLCSGERLNYRWPSSIGVDSAGGLLVTWNGYPDIMGARVNASGAWSQDPYWVPDEGGRIGGPSAYEPVHSMTEDGLGGWVVAWPDRRLIMNPNYDDSTRAIFAQRILDAPVSAKEPRAGVSSSFSLAQNYPNPFNPVTVFEVKVPVTSRVAVKVYDILGREVETLADRVMTAGAHRLLWNCETCASGTYIVVLSAPHVQIVREAILLK